MKCMNKVIVAVYNVTPQYDSLFERVGTISGGNIFKKSNKALHYLSDGAYCVLAEGRITELVDAVCLLIDLTVMSTLWAFLSRVTNRSKAEQK